MPRTLSLLAISAITAGCIGNPDDGKRLVPSALTAAADPIATVTVIGADTLGDSARIHYLAPEPDGKSIAFLFADPANGITQGLGIVQVSGGQLPQLGWPDSVTSVWWSGPHQLSFTAGTGRGVRLVVDAHAAQLEAMEVTDGRNPPGSGTSVTKPGTNALSRTQAGTNALSRAQAFIDSVRVQPEGMPQGSTLRYRADSIIVAPSDTLAAVHVSASDIQGTKVNPAWYLVHLPSGHVQAIDSLTGRSSGLSAAAGQWGADGAFYYAKERSLWRVRPSVQ